MSITRASIVLAASTLFACTAPVGTAPEETGSAREAIGGANVTSVDPNNSGYVILHLPGGGCSGALLYNNWVITAKHCFQGATAANAIQVVMGWQTAVGSAFYLHPSADVGLLKLASPMVMNGSTTGFVRPINRQPMSFFYGAPLQCYGYGLPDWPTLRTTVMRMQGPLTPTDYQLVPWDIANPNLMLEGDSGGVCQFGDGSIVGIQSLEFYVSNTSMWDEQVSASAVASWVDGTISGWRIRCPIWLCPG